VHNIGSLGAGADVPPDTEAEPLLGSLDDEVLEKLRTFAFLQRQHLVSV